MSKLNILYYPDKRLRKISTPVKKINYKITYIINKMFEIMYKLKGIGLAAPQVNINKQIIIININNIKRILINPVILMKKGKISVNESCLSIPLFYKKVIRAKYIILNALDINGKYYKLIAKNLLAICIQHELDHLKGKLLIDYN